MIDAAARETHFVDHLAPVWAALDPDERGTFTVTRKAAEHAWSLGLDVVVAEHLPAGRTPVLVASWGDLRRARTAGRPVILMEHGAGQSYLGVDVGSYVGSRDRGGVLAVLVPGAQPAARHAAAHPDLPVHVVGCPKLDAWHDLPPRRNHRPVVAIAHHWACHVVPETRDAYSHFAPAYPDVAAAFPGALGHVHPRSWEPIARRMARHGLRMVRPFAAVVDQADVLVVDNSSVLFEFAALDRPVVVLNAPWYRRHVHHGGRFWDWADVGVQVDDPRDLVAAIHEALEDPPAIARRRREIVAEVYAHRGDAAHRAVAAVRQTIGALR